MSDAPPKLKREVEPPQRSNSGISVLIVASLGMFFALASSALVLRARMAHCRDAARATTRVQAPIIAPAAAPTPCGQARVVDNGDGTATITFDTCSAPSLVTVDEDARAVATPLPADTSFAVPR